MHKTQWMPALAVCAALALPAPALAGKVKKAVIGAGLVTAGVIAYKIAKKMNVGSLTENLANYPGNVEKYCRENFERCRNEAVPEVRVILVDPELTPEQKRPYVVLEQTLIRIGVWTGPTSTAGPTQPPAAAPQVAMPNLPPAATTTQVYGGLPDDEALLEQNLIAAGVQKLPGYVALHLVQFKDASYAQASKILTRFRIDRNDARNGTFVDAETAQRLKRSAQKAQITNQMLLAAQDAEASENSIAWGLYDLQDYVQKNSASL